LLKNLKEHSNFRVQDRGTSGDQVKKLTGNMLNKNHGNTLKKLKELYKKLQGIRSEISGNIRKFREHKEI